MGINNLGFAVFTQDHPVSNSLFNSIPESVIKILQLSPALCCQLSYKSDGLRGPFVPKIQHFVIPFLKISFYKSSLSVSRALCNCAYTFLKIVLLKLRELRKKFKLTEAKVLWYYCLTLQYFLCCM